MQHMVQMVTTGRQLLLGISSPHHALLQAYRQGLGVSLPLLAP